MGLTTTPNALPYPVRADTPDVPRDIQALAVGIEQLLPKYAQAPYFGKPYILSGGAITAGTGNSINISAGVAVINGWRFAFAAQTNLAMTASTTNHVWLQMTVDGSGNYTGVAWVVNITTALVTNGVYVGQVVEGASAPTTMDASFRGVIAPGGLIAKTTWGSEAVSASQALGAAGWTAAIATQAAVLDGVTPYRLELEWPSLYASIATTIVAAVWDGAVGATTPPTANIPHSSLVSVAGVNVRQSVSQRKAMAATLGKKTYNTALFLNGAGTVGWDGGGDFRLVWDF